MDLNAPDMNIIVVQWENDILVPVALRWKYSVSYLGGRKIIIIPSRGILVKKVKKAIGRELDEQNDEDKARQPSYGGPPQKHKPRIQDSQINSSVARSNQSSVYNSTPRKRPFLWSTRENSDSKTAKPAQQNGTIGRPSSSSGSPETQPGQKIGATDGPSSRGLTKTQPPQKLGTTDGGPSSRGLTQTQPPQKLGPTDGGPSSRGLTQTQPPQKLGPTDGPSSRGGTKTQPPQKPGPTDGGPSSRGLTQTQPPQKLGTTDGPSSRGLTKSQPPQKVGVTGSSLPSNGSTQPKSEFSQFEKECLDEHNKLRAIHNAPPLTLSRNLCNYSQEWANHLVEIGGMKHRTEGKYGENLYMSSGLSVDARKPVKSWYDEIKFYTYGSDFSPSTGHFTQVVWKGSKELGCAFAQKGNEIYVVANYNPPGNVQGQFSANVLPPKN